MTKHSLLFTATALEMRPCMEPSFVTANLAMKRDGSGHPAATLMRKF